MECEVLKVSQGDPDPWHDFLWAGVMSLKSEYVLDWPRNWEREDSETDNLPFVSILEKGAKA